MAASPTNIQKANTEYIGVRKQAVQAKLNAGKIAGQSAKNMYQEQAAQRIMDTLQSRIENALEQSFDDWTVVQSFGDNSRKCVAKVRVSPDEFVHVFCSRQIRADPWAVAFDPYKAQTDILSDNMYDYEELQDTYGDMVCHDVGCTLQ